MEVLVVTDVAGERVRKMTGRFGIHQGHPLAVEFAQTQAQEQT